MQVSLNCFMMLATFSHVIMSSLPLSWCWLKIRNVSRSNRTASLQREISHRFCRVFLMNFWLGMSCCTMLDQAWYKDSSQMLVAKYFLMATFSRSAISATYLCFFSIFFSRSS